ncbi:uncharacterized protein [Amphiura filiformis]|uniref:uncharacterized protein n=1 Tax=Amphiura filiformis TaxID=82378 RepID=UPI003B217B7B
MAKIEYTKKAMSKKYMDNARKDYETTITRIHDDMPQTSVKLFVNYGLFLLRYDTNKHGKEAMNRLKQGIKIAVTKCTVTNGDNVARFQGNVEWECKRAITTFEKYNLDQLKKDGEDSIALKSLGWLVHFVGDMEKVALRSRKSALEYYDKALKTCQEHDEERKHEILQGLIDCHLKRGQEPDFNMAEVYVGKLREINTEEGRIKTADWKLAEGRALVNKQLQHRARSLFLAAVDVGSFEACLTLGASLDPSVAGPYPVPADWGWDKVSNWRFRKDCARIIHCLEDPDGVLSRTRTIAGLSRHDDTEDKKHIDRAAKEDTIKMVNIAMKLEDKHFRGTRSTHFDLERSLLNKSPVENDVIDQCKRVITSARNMLDHAVMKFGEKHYSVTPEGTKKGAWKYPYINQGHSQPSVEAELHHRLENKSKWKDFKTKFPNLHLFLVKVQPATNPATYKWVSAMANLTNVDKHKEFVERLDPELEIGKHPDGTKITEKFNLVKLARSASEGVEEIVNEFYKYV